MRNFDEWWDKDHKFDRICRLAGRPMASRFALSAYRAGQAEMRERAAKLLEEENYWGGIVRGQRWRETMELPLEGDETEDEGYHHASTVFDTPEMEPYDETESK